MILSNCPVEDDDSKKCPDDSDCAKCHYNLKAIAKATESQTPLGQAELAGSVTKDFKDGVFWYEKQLYDLLQSKGWGDVCAARIVSEMAEIVAKKAE